MTTAAANELLKPSKPVKAFIVETDDPDDSVVQFATTNVAARRQGANGIGCDFSQVTCRRLHWADEFAGQVIPAKAYIDNGWRISCFNCGDMVYKGSYSVDDDGNERFHDPVYRGGDLFCCSACEAAHDAEVSDQNAKFAAFESRVRELRPDLQYKAFRGAYPYRTMTGEFMFDGAKYGGSVRDDGDGELQWYVAQGDKAAWDFYEQQRKEVAL